MHQFVPVVLGLVILVSIRPAPAAADDHATCLAVNGGANNAEAVDACARVIESGKFRASELGRLYNSRGLALTNLGQYDRAISDLTRALRIVKKEPILFNNRGLAYNAKGEYDLAIADYSEAVRLNPKYEDAFHNRARAYYEKPDYARAIADYGEAIRLNPKSSSSYSGRGAAYFKNGEQDRALADFNEQIRLGSKDASDYHNRGFTYEAKGEFDKALADFRTALAMNPQYKGAADGIQRIEQKLTASASAKSVSVPQTSTSPVPAAPQVAALPQFSPPPAAIRAPNEPGRRVALVIGNSVYRSVARLDNPVNDAKLMAETLRGLGFTLIGDGAQLDLDKSTFDNAVQKFGNELQGANVGLFYYAGHGLQLRGTNYLVPVNANPTRETDVDFQMVDAAVVLRQMEASGTKLNVVMLDACRNNPFGGRGLRASSGGLAQMQAPEGTLISYATQPGNVAQDGQDGDSPYTKALAKMIRKPGLDIFQTFNEVGLEVKRSTGGAQQPWLSSSPIEGVFYFKPGS